MISALITLIIYAAVVGLLLWLLFYVLDQFTLPHPFGKIIRIVAVVIAVLIIVILLLDLLGNGGVGLPRLR
jgi:hypothetical protein